MKSKKPWLHFQKTMYYIPLIILASVNLWSGVKVNYSLIETVCYIGSMLLVGFLFKAMSKNNVRTAIIVSSITFGIGHIVNLFNGSGTDILSNFVQVCYAIAIGYLFVTLFHRGKSLWPCIITHSILNALSVFAKETGSKQYQIFVAMILCAISIGYSLILMKTIPASEE